MAASESEEPWEEKHKGKSEEGRGLASGMRTCLPSVALDLFLSIMLWLVL